MTDKIRGAVQAGRPACGSWIAVGDSLSAEIIGGAGYDFVILDTQHGGVTWENMLPILQALDLGGTRALVRVGWTDQMQIMRAMDLGALGVVVPMVSTVAQAKLAADAIRYPPQGIRSFGKVRNYYTSSGEAAAEPLCFVMIETAEAMENLEAIAATSGVDGLFVGPVDLALSLGHGPAMVMPAAVLAAIDQVIDACRRNNIISGCAALGMANAQALTQSGMQLLAISSDIGLLRRGAAADLALAKQWPLSDSK